MIQLKSITKSYDGFSNIVENINLEIKEGEILALLGPSGSGKTTLLKMINGLSKPSNGEVLFKEKELSSYDITSLRRKMGYVIQEVGLFPHYTVAENISLVPSLLSYPETKQRKLVSNWMKLLKLDHDSLSKQYPANLSGGQAQRVGLARALAAEPELVLMDEPFSALDPEVRKQIRSDFLAIQKRQSMTAVIVTHDLLEAIEMADRICFISGGSIQQLSDPQSFIFQPANKLVVDFISSDKYKAGLAACTFGDVQSYLDQQIDLPMDLSLLTILNQEATNIQKDILEAFYKWKGEKYG